MEKQIRIEREFIPGQGHLVREVPFDAPANGAAQVLGNIPGPPPEKITIANVNQHLESLGLIAVPKDEYHQLLERMKELEGQLDHAAKGGDVPPVPATTGKKKSIKEDTRSLEEKIADASSLEELTDLMKTVDDPAALKLADARAEELKAGGVQ